jgi:glutamate-1-semialdehyde 2,1-aminomutase
LGKDSIDTWRKRAEELFPGGVNSPVRAYRAVGGDAPVMVRGEGSLVWDADGGRYIDYIGAFGPLILGHAHPAVVKAIKAAVEAGGSFGATSPAEVRLGELIRTCMPSVERLRFVNSGTEAAMSALRVAGVTERVAAQTLVAGYNDLDSVAAIFDTNHNKVAAVIVEPVAANMGVIPPASGFLAGLRKLCDDNGALLTFDEVITGFRVGPGGAQELFGVQPDLTVLGKIIGGGLPVGAYGGRADLMDLVAPAGPVYQAGTLSGHPVVMAAGEATMLLLDANFYAALEGRADRLAQGLRGLGFNVARVGSLLTVFFRDRLPANFREAKECDTTEFASFFHRLRSGGVLIPPSQFEAWFVSGAHDDAAIEATLRAAS